MPYRVLTRRKVQKQLARIHPQDRDRVGAAMFGLADDPRPHAARKMRGTGNLEDWRVRIGDYRIVYRIDDEAEEVLVLDVGHRGSVYG